MIPEFKSVSQINEWLVSIRPRREAVREELRSIVAESQREPNSQAKVAIVGSFKFKPQIDQVIERLEDSGIEVLVPPKGKVVKVDPSSNFPLIEVDAERGPLDVEDDFMRGLARADVIYIVNPGGYSGIGSAVEWGTASEWGKLFILMEPLNLSEEEGNPTYEFLRLTTPVLAVDELIDQVIRKVI